MVQAPSRDELFRMKSDYGDSRSQILQDVFVLRMLGHKPGYFVEFGAASGVELSNTYLLEKQFVWKGILAEPARTWHPLIAARRTAKLDKRCVWRQSCQKLIFHQHPDANLSALEAFDAEKSQPRDQSWYEVETVSLDDLLEDAGAPVLVDYLSMDVEGAELDVLEGYSFDRMFKVATIEHNHDQHRRKAVHEIMSRRGYERVCESFSDFDDWYVHPELIGASGGR